MEQSALPNKTKRIMTVSMVLIFMSTIIIFFIGHYTKLLNTEVGYLREFLTNSNTVQANFEKSLQIYTEGTNDIIKFLQRLRPLKEEEFIKFISEVEKIGDKNNLNLKIKSINIPTDKKNKEKILGYHIQFLGTLNDLISFSRDLENLPYYIRISNIDFTDPNLIDYEDQKVENSPTNIDLKIELFIK